MQPVIVVGDKTTGGGVVLEGSPQSDINGKPMARVGDKVTCPAHKGVFPIATGDPNHLVDNKPVAYHGCKVACGCALIASQTLLTTGGTSQGYDAAGQPLAETLRQRSPYGIQFQCRNDLGQPVANRGYIMIRGDGATLRGKTDAQGLTEPIEDATAEAVKIIFDFAAPAKEFGRESLSA